MDKTEIKHLKENGCSDYEIHNLLEYQKAMQKYESSLKWQRCQQTILWWVCLPVAPIIWLIQTIKDGE